MNFPQTTYVQNFVQGRLGMLYRAAANTRDIGALPALVACNPGDLLEKVYDSTTNTYSVRPAQAASGALKALAGVALFVTARQPAALVNGSYTTTGAYAIGEMVPFVRCGKVYAKFISADGATAQVPYTTPNYEHSTTTLASQGAFTDKATASTAGAEVDAAPVGIQMQEDVTSTLGFGICLVELNLP